MANTIISPDMNMPVPVVSVDPGPDWATNINACLSIIDSHNHTPGQGVQITPAGIDINTDLPMNDNNLTTARSVRFSPQGVAISDPADLGCLYERGVDLYYIDGAGNQIRLTQSGSPAGATGTITGLPSGTASAAFSGSTFTFQSATNTPASLNVGPITIGQPVASGFGVTLTPSVSQASNYNLTLPVALPPVVPSALVSDTSGNLSFLQIASGRYTPTITPVTNVTSTSAVTDMFYTRVGNIVTCTGSLFVNVTTPSGITTAFLISLPIVSALASANNLCGMSASALINTAQDGDIIGDPASNSAEVVFFGIGDARVNYSFSYQVI